ncbi:hypothetical protein F4803DRAFT_553092 [Xylaria telfairii]|nr:hypothetical protein F4803DRAFT_553092 [Xylaria telfairii]
MQAIRTLLFLALLYLAEAGLLRAPRTATSEPQTFSAFQITTSTTTTTITPPATFIIPAQTSPTSTALPYGFVAIVETASTSDPAPTEAPALAVIDAGGSKFVQTTFWACETFPMETHCGWHEPLLEVSSGAAAPYPRRVFVRAGAVAAFVAGVLLRGV